MASPGYDWRSSPLRHSPDTTSPMYPDRPIRPLPKRRLRARLSPEQAETIVYPPAPPTSGPIFQFPPYNPAEKPAPQTPQPTPMRSLRSGDADHNHICSCGADHSPGESDDEDVENEHGLQSSPSLLQVTRNNLRGGRGSTRGVGEGGSKPPPPESTTSSADGYADGYDSFENTSNKKKRKVPANSMGAHHTSLSSEMGNMRITAQPGDGAMDDPNGVGQYYGSGASAVSAPSPGTGLSGAGRGRFGRAGRGSSDRRPLGASTNGLNAYASGGSAKGRRDWNGSSPASAKGSQPDQGIISAAIANAAEQGPLEPQQGNENVSLLQQQASKATGQKAQFTFTCESDTSKTIWPVQQPPMQGVLQSAVPPGQHMPYPQSSRRGVAAAGTQTGTNGLPATAQSHPPPPPTTGPAAQGPPPPPTKPKKPRKPGRIYAIAARQRRLQQEYTNYHHPPSREDIWICEFCEYEAIFGSAPEALIRQYEIKDRKERKRLAEKRRLLEKAKMKGRKGKKNTKKASAAQAQQNQASQQAASQRYDQLDNGQNADAGSEEFYEDEFDDAGMDAAPQAQQPVQQAAKANPGGGGVKGHVHAGGGGGSVPVAKAA